jgi:hypothetical protein
VEQDAGCSSATGTVQRAPETVNGGGRRGDFVGSEQGHGGGKWGSGTGSQRCGHRFICTGGKQRALGGETDGH